MLAEGTGQRYTNTKDLFADLEGCYYDKSI